MKKIFLLYAIRALFLHIEFKRKIQLLFLLATTIFSAVLEMITIASVVPFLKIVTSQNFEKELIYILKFTTVENKIEAVIVSGSFFACMYLLNSLLRVFLIYITTKLSEVIGAEFGLKIYKTKLNQSYIEHINQNSINLISVITQKIQELNKVLLSVINFISGSVIFLCIAAVLIWINPKIVLIVLFLFGFLYLIIALLIKKTITQSSHIVNELQNNIIKNLQNALGAIRDIILDNSQKFYLKAFIKMSLLKARKQTIAIFLLNSPKYVLEGFGAALFVLILIFSSNTELDSVDFSNTLATLGALVIGSLRIIPLLNTLYWNFANIKNYSYQVDEILTILNTDLAKQEKNSLFLKRDITFENAISLRNLSFSYSKNKTIILNKINLEIRRGSRIGIVGKTGEGKSTFLDLLMGLLEPDEGNIYIDETKLSKETIRSWQSKIAHVPQKIFLSDSSFLENIAFGEDLENIDLKRVELVSKKTQIHDVIMKCDMQYEEKVGERGVKLSGGQIQRIALARALYKKAEIIIFDEATNSLDEETEKLIMEELSKLDKNLTIIIVAHRLKTLKNCDQIFEIKNKKVEKIKLIF